MKLSKDLKTIYLFAIICAFISIVTKGILYIQYDSMTYISASENYLNGNIDLFRTPVYPVILGGLRMLFGEQYYLWSTICLQYAISLVSGYFFYKLSNTLIKSKDICFWITLFYMAYPSMTRWNNYILTESFAISGTVLFLYILVRLFREASVTLMISYVLTLLFLLFLRPAFIYIIPVLFLVFLILFFRKRSNKVFGVGIFGLLVCTIALFSYMKVYERQYGIFASSNVSIINHYYIARQNGLFYTDGVDDYDDNLKNYILESYEKNGRTLDDHLTLWSEAMDVIEKFELKEIDKLLSTSYRHNSIDALKSIGGRLYRSSQTFLFFAGFGFFDTVFDILGLSLGMDLLYLFLLLYVLVMMRWMLKRKQIPLISSTFLLLGISSVH